jgi:hypothetical protein
VCTAHCPEGSALMTKSALLLSDVGKTIIIIIKLPN